MSETTPPAAPAKSILRSVTFWVQLLAMVSALVPAVQSWIAANPVDSVAVLAAINLIVRYASSGKVIIFPSAGENSSGTKTSGGMSPLAIGVLLTLSTAAVGFLPSCSSASEYPVAGFLSYQDPNTGATVGVSVGGSKAKKPKLKKPKISQPAEIDSQSGK